MLVNAARTAERVPAGRRLFDADVRAAAKDANLSHRTAAELPLTQTRETLTAPL
ncbi:hypothetical protein [Paractinoplanes lichenicola]|uniref:Uncharacterized protein n=1 Tax=Paractinoplanes lichenicola TaxID=2802976 RepID=A0ABS1W633_9ACTN|nr:hypothetical protein [Actinoplanes lichenicola]MBL7262196.1 hypothetical protein [Actinoplanes lichenicola]